MKPYIDFNTERRKEATNEADKNHFKLLNNAVYGKTMENMRQRIKIRVVKNSQDFIKYTSRPTCVNWKVFENNLAAIHKKKISLTLSKPIYVGFTVLETTKWETFNFHYNFMKKNLNILHYCLPILAVYVMKVMKIFINGFMNTKNYLIQLIALKIVYTFVIGMKKYSAKSKMHMEEI